MSKSETIKPTIWSELHDPKEGRKLREIRFVGKCDECGEYDGHQLDCTSVTVESMVRLVLRAKRHEEEARKRADRNWNLLTKYQGKLAVLKHENNKLRAANKKLRELK